MAEGIRANLKDITNGVKLLAEEAKKAANATAQVNTKLKFDSSNVSLVVERFDALNNELDANNKKLEGLRSALQRLGEERAKEKGDTAESKANIAEIAKLQANYAAQIQKAEMNQERLNQLLSSSYKNTQIINAATKQITDKYEVWIQASQKLAEATKKLYNVLKNVVTEAADTGIALSATAKRYNTSAEDVQEWNRALELATGQSELFTQSLSVLVKGMAQIAAGRGVAFTKALKNIGIAYKDIKDLSATEQFERIVEGLANVENYSQRAAAAQQLFGESGQYITSVLEQGDGVLDGYIEKAKSFGIISNSNVEALAEMEIRLRQANAQFDEAKAQLAIALAPALEIITDIVRNFLAPAIRTLSSGFQKLGKVGQTVILIVGAGLILLPKVISGLALVRISLLSVQAGATKAAVAVNLLKTSLISIGVAGAVIGVVAGIAAAFGSVSEKADEANESIKDFVEVGKELGAVGGNIQANTEATATSMTTKTVDISVEITGKGDTEISDDAAVTVAQLTADEVQKAWGELVK